MSLCMLTRCQQSLGAPRGLQSGRQTCNSNFWLLWTLVRAADSVYVCVTARKWWLLQAVSSPFTVRVEGASTVSFWSAPQSDLSGQLLQGYLPGRRRGCTLLYVCLTSSSTSFCPHHINTSRNHNANLDNYSSIPYRGLDEKGFNNTCSRR